MAMRVGIVGCGLIGQKRARALGGLPLVAVADANLARAQQLAAAYPGCLASADGQALAARPDVDLVIVATTNNAQAAITSTAIRHGKHVLVEKPAARNALELAPVLGQARAAGVTVKVGFNHRFHPAFAKARAIVDAGELGPLLYIRGRYGHGGRIGYDKEWRADPALAGGGELLDQGVHLIDLSRWFLGEIAEVRGHIASYFWKMPVEDNGFMCLRSTAGQVAWLHASCTEWKNLFCFEIFGQNGKLQIDGLGGSYGVERLSFYRMLPQMGPPETTMWEYPGEDLSWRDEFAHLVRSIEKGEPPSGTLEDAHAALQVVAEIYRQAEADAAPRNIILPRRKAI
jgi:predicted dehydrogenase